MIGLSLLSPEQKQALRARVFYAQIERLMLTLIICAALASAALLAIRSMLEKNLGDVQTHQVLAAEYVTVNNDVKALNLQITRVEALQKLAISPSSLLKDVALRTPPGVTVTNLDFDVKTASMRLSGMAKTRDALLAYEAAMRQSPYVKELDSPISNLFQKDSVNFQFRIILNVDALKASFEPAP